MPHPAGTCWPMPTDFHIISTALYPHGKTLWSQDRQVASVAQEGLLRQVPQD